MLRDLKNIMSCIIIMKEIIQEKQEIIDHIEAKLAQLRAQRNQLETKKYAKDPVKLASNKLPQRPAVKASQIEKLQLENNLNQLQKLYEAKKELTRIGIKTNDPSEIQKYQNDPKWTQYVQRKKKTAIQNAEKQKIIQEEMIKTKQFLASKKVSTKQISQLQEMNYRNILKEKLQELQKYHSMVTKMTLNRLQKEDLIAMTFQLLRECNKVVKKDVLKAFLLANPQFCGHFHITHEEINRDLQVLETEESGVLDYIEFLQFVKSIEITSVHLRPSLANKAKKQKKITDNLLQKLVINETIPKDGKEQKLSEREHYRRLIQYLRKVFKNFVRGNETIVERTKFFAALQKALYFDAVKDKGINKEGLKELADFMVKKTRQKGEKSYYKELDSKFINWGQIQQFCKLYRSEKAKKDSKEVSETEIVQLEVSNQFEGQSIQNQPSEQEEDELQYSQSTSFDLSQRQGKIITQKDYERYGWNQNSPDTKENDHETDPKANIKELDSFSKQVGQKYFGEIAWGGFEEYKPDFKQLEAFIKLQEKKNVDEIHQESHKKAQNLSKISQSSMSGQENDKKQWQKY